jgi:NADH-quinone oxidoreductase subunit M
MTELHVPWLEIAVLIPLLGAISVHRLLDPRVIQHQSMIFSGLTLACTLAAWQDFGLLHQFEAHDNLHLVDRLLGKDIFVIDELSAPLLPMTALIYLLTIVATVKTRFRRFSFAWTMVSESIALALLCCKDPTEIVWLLAIGCVPILIQLLSYGESIRVFAIHMTLSIALLAAGLYCRDASTGFPTTLSAILLVAGVWIRSGIVPLHCWVTDLFERGPFGSAIVFVTPMAGAYAAARLVLPTEPSWALRGMALVSLFTTVYAAGMSLVQREARRFFCFVFLSCSALVLVGMQIATPVSLAGALAVWISVGLALTGFGLTLRAVESRTGRLSLVKYHGLFDHIKTLAAFFLLTGLASVGFPGTVGFVAVELLVDGIVEAYPLVGTVVVLAAALTGIAIVQVFFRIFAGRQHSSTLSLTSRPLEKLAVLTLAVLVIGGGLLPQRGIHSRYHAACEIVHAREANLNQQRVHRESRRSALAAAGEERP